MRSAGGYDEQRGILGAVTAACVVALALSGSPRKEQQQDVLAHLDLRRAGGQRLASTLPLWRIRGFVPPDEVEALLLSLPANWDACNRTAEEHKTLAGRSCARLPTASNATEALLASLRSVFRIDFAPASLFAVRYAPGAAGVPPHVDKYFQRALLPCVLGAAPPKTHGGHSHVHAGMPIRRATTSPSSSTSAHTSRASPSSSGSASRCAATVSRVFTRRPWISYYTKPLTCQVRPESGALLGWMSTHANAEHSMSPLGPQEGVRIVLQIGLNLREGALEEPGSAPLFIAPEIAGEGPLGGDFSPDCNQWCTVHTCNEEGCGDCPSTVHPCADLKHGRYCAARCSKRTTKSKFCEGCCKRKCAGPGCHHSKKWCKKHK